MSEVLCESVCGDAGCVRAVHLRDNERSTDVDVKSCQGCARARDLPGQGVLCVTAYAAFVHNIHHITPPIVLALDPVSALCVLYLCLATGLLLRESHFNYVLHLCTEDPRRSPRFLSGLGPPGISNGPIAYLSLCMLVCS